MIEIEPIPMNGCDEKCVNSYERLWLKNCLFLLKIVIEKAPVLKGCVWWFDQ